MNYAAKAVILLHCCHFYRSNDSSLGSCNDICARAKRLYHQLLFLFQPMPLGYGNWFPILTALLSLVALILLLAGFWKHTKKPVVTCLSIAVSASVMSWLLFHSISSTSIAIALLHVAALLLELFPSQEKSFALRTVFPEHSLL